MKRLLAFILIWGLLVVTGSIVSANSQSRADKINLRVRISEKTDRTNNGGK